MNKLKRLVNKLKVSSIYIYLFFFELQENHQCLVKPISFGLSRVTTRQRNSNDKINSVLQNQCQDNRKPTPYNIVESK